MSISRSLLLILPFIFCIRAVKARSITEDSTTGKSFFRNSITANQTAHDSTVMLTRIKYARAKKKGNRKEIADAAWLLGTDESHRGKFDSADYYYQESLKYYQALDLEDQMLKAYSMLGVNEGIQSHSAKALHWLLKAKQLAKKLKNEKQLAETDYRIGNIYWQVGDYKNAIRHEEAALEYALKAKDRKIQIAANSNLGMIYTELKKYDIALGLLQSAYNLSASGSDSSQIPEIIYNMGRAYLRKGELDSANIFLTRSLTQVTEANYPLGIATVRYMLGELSISGNEMQKALGYAKESLRLSTVLKDSQLIHLNSIALAKIFRTLGDYRNSSDYFERAIRIGDALKIHEDAKLVERMNMEVERKKVSQEIEDLQAQLSFRRQERNKALVVGAILLLATLIVVAGILTIMKKNRKLLEQQKELQEAGEIKNRILAIIAHDLRSPLTAITGSFDLLKEDALPDKDKKYLLHELQRSANATLDTLDNLLQWGAEQFNKRNAVAEAVNVKDLIEETTSLLSTTALQKSIGLKNTVDETYYAYFDRNQLAFIIRNLIANGIKFSRVGQSVTCAAAQADNRILVSVADEGVGMSEEQKAIVLNKSIRSSTLGTAGEKGVGLGIAMVQEFLERNGGFIEVESTEGKGSKFTINIPAC